MLANVGFQKFLKDTQISLLAYTLFRQVNPVLIDRFCLLTPLLADF